MEMEATGMNTVATAISSQLSADSLWGVFGACVPLITTITLVSLGFYLIRRAVKRLSKMRGGI